MSPYARSLMELMLNAPTELERARAEVLLGCYWARVGDIAMADEIRQRSRAKYPSGRYGEITIMHMCLDGLILYYSEQSPASADRLRSAHALASTYKLREEQAFSAAWLAHVEFNRDRWEAMFDALRSCLAAMDVRDKATCGRLSLVVADALTHCGEFKFAKRWYEHARLLLTSIGDHAAIEAFMYNGAALRLHAARLRRLHGPVSAEELVVLGGEIASATNYQRITNLRSLDYLLAAATANHKILQEKFEEAKPILSDLLDAGKIPKASKAPPLLLADFALCVARLGDEAAAREAIERAAFALSDDLSDDDAAVATYSLAVACELVGYPDKAAYWKTRSEDSLRTFELTQSRLRAGMDPWMRAPGELFAVTDGH